MNKQEALTRIRNNVWLSQVERLESITFASIVDQALAHPVGVDRWPCYERLKRQANEIVGWDATQPELSTSEHYEALVGFIDALLPVASEHDIPDQDDLANRRKRGGGPRHISECVDDFLQDLEKRYRANQAG